MIIICCVPAQRTRIASFAARAVWMANARWACAASRHLPKTASPVPMSGLSSAPCRMSDGTKVSRVSSIVCRMSDGTKVSRVSSAVAVLLSQGSLAARRHLQAETRSRTCRGRADEASRSSAAHSVAPAAARAPPRDIVIITSHFSLVTARRPASASMGRATTPGALAAVVCMLPGVHAWAGSPAWPGLPAQLGVTARCFRNASRLVPHLPLGHRDLTRRARRGALRD